MERSYSKRARLYRHARMARHMHRHGRHHGAAPGRRIREMREFFAANPECASALATHRVRLLREEGYTPDEIRDELELMQEFGSAPDADIDSILGE